MCPHFMSPLLVLGLTKGFVHLALCLWLLCSPYIDFWTCKLVLFPFCQKFLNFQWSMSIRCANLPALPSFVVQRFAVLLQDGGICLLIIGDSNDSLIHLCFRCCPQESPVHTTPAPYRPIVFPANAALRASLCLLQFLSEFFSTLFSDCGLLEVSVGVPHHLRSKHEV